jgi:chromosome segregation ATPase
MTEKIIIIALILALIYLAYQNRQLQTSRSRSANTTDSELEKQLIELENEKDDLEAERDIAIRKKQEAEAEVLAINNRLRNKSQEATHKDEEITRLKSEKTAQATALNKKIQEWKEKYKDKSKLFDEEQLEAKKLDENIATLQAKITELETERKNLLAEISKNEDLDEFTTWLNEDESRKADLPEWDKVIGEVKQKARDYHLAQSNWSSGWLKGNKEYWKVFEAWVETDEDGESTK